MIVKASESGLLLEKKLKLDTIYGNEKEVPARIKKKMKCCPPEAKFLGEKNVYQLQFYLLKVR